MKRRDFFQKGAAAGAAMLLGLEGISSIVSHKGLTVAAAPDLVAVMGGEPEVMLDRALQSLGGISRYVKKGQKIVIKPNIGWDRAPELSANTNPKLVGALVKKCVQAGASKVTVFDNTCDNWQKCYASSGIADAVKAAGGVMMPADTESYYVEVALPQGVSLKSTKIHRALIEADAWINVPVLKNHGGAKITCCMKNYMGIVWDRRYFHRNDLPQCIADVCTWSKRPVLNIVDAYRVMRQNGPKGTSAGDVSVLKTLIASSDIVAADTAAINFFNQVEKMPISSVAYIAKGEALKIGTSNLGKLNIARIKV